MIISGTLRLLYLLETTVDAKSERGVEYLNSLSIQVSACLGTTIHLPIGNYYEVT